MAGRRLVDAAKLFNASKSVAHKHIALRSSQLDAFNKTSTLAKAAKDQTDRITVTAAAAIALSKRFSEDAPAYARAAANQATGTPRQHEDIPRKDTVRRDVHAPGAKEGLEQDHHYDRSEQNSATRPPPETDLEIEQEEAQRRPLPDGTIPSAGVTLEQEEKGQDTFSERLVPEAPKEPLVDDQHGQTRQDEKGIEPIESDESTIPLPGKPRGDTTANFETIPSHANDLQQSSKSSRLENLQEGHDRDVFYSRSVESQPAPSSQPQSQIPAHTGTSQAGDEHVDDKQLNQDVFYSAPETGSQQTNSQQDAVPKEENLPDGINTDVFHSKRVADMLKNDSSSRKERLRSRGPSRNPFIPPQYQAGHGHSTGLSEKTKPSIPEQPAQATQTQTTEKEMRDLASQLVQDPQSNVTAAPEVRLSRLHTRSILIS
jgi:aarF domain-containing kinase